MSSQASNLRQLIHRLYREYSVGRLDAVLAYFDDDIDFVSYGPVDILPFLGRKKGKRELGTAMLAVHEDYEILKYEPTSFVVEADNAAIVVAARLKQRATGRVIQLSIANFLRFRDGLIYEFREFMDSFDLVEQVLGHEILLPRTQPMESLILRRFRRT